MINIENKKANIKTKAEYVITVTWDLNNPDDVDTYLRDPAGQIAYFGRQTPGLMHLDRDDLGEATDTYILPDGTKIVYPYNQEITSIRGFVPGRWILNIHMYKKNQKAQTNITVKMEKLNPSIKTIFIKDYVMQHTGEEITVQRFDMDATGDIVHMDEIQEELVRHKLTEVRPDT